MTSRNCNRKLWCFVKWRRACNSMKCAMNSVYDDRSCHYGLCLSSSLVGIPFGYTCHHCAAPDRLWIWIIGCSWQSHRIFCGSACFFSPETSWNQYYQCVFMLILRYFKDLRWYSNVVHISDVKFDEIPTPTWRRCHATIGAWDTPVPWCQSDWIPWALLSSIPMIKIPIVPRPPLTSRRPRFAQGTT